MGEDAVYDGEVLSASDVICDEFDDAVWNWCGYEFFEKGVVVDGIKGFGHVKSYCDCALGGLVLVESCGYVVCYLLESCGCGMGCFEAVLVIYCWDVVCNVREYDFF